MKTVQKYESEDGVTFDTEEACLEHEKEVALLARVTYVLGNRNIDAEDVVRFLYDEGYVK